MNRFPRHKHGYWYETRVKLCHLPCLSGVIAGVSVRGLVSRTANANRPALQVTNTQHIHKLSPWLTRIVIIGRIFSQCISFCDTCRHSLLCFTEILTKQLTLTAVYVASCYLCMSRGKGAPGGLMSRVQLGRGHRMSLVKLTVSHRLMTWSISPCCGDHWYMSVTCITFGFLPREAGSLC